MFAALPTARGLSPAFESRRAPRAMESRQHPHASNVTPSHRRPPSASRARDGKRKRKVDSLPQPPIPPSSSKRRKRWPVADGSRKWIHSHRDLSALKDRFVLLSYNILGDENARRHADLYNRVDPLDLEWERRKRKICKEIARYHAGILCLQEVDHFDDLASLLQKEGYSGVYKGRTGDAKDGCAIFWREKQFTVLHHESIEFQKFGLRNNVAQLCVFKMHADEPSTCANGNFQKAERSLDRIFVVGNIHVLFNPNRGDIKLGQVRLLLEKAHTMLQKWGNCPVVIAGDLNSMPQSALYQFLSSSKLDIRMHDRRKISAQNGSFFKQSMSCYQYGTARRQFSSFSSVNFSWSEEEILLAVGRTGATHLHHPLKLFSAYPGVPGSSCTRDNLGEPLITSYHSKFMGTVDYIWHSQEIVPIRVLDLLPVDIIRKTGGLPSKKWGSDHLALVSELAFQSDASDTG